MQSLKERKKTDLVALRKKMQNMSKEALQAAIKKKKECNDRALQIVYRLIEPEVEKEWFLNNLKFINKSHLEDVVDERFIQKYCGYPLCDNKIENVPQKQYHISLRSKKVYDITNRKKFCGNSCYKALLFIENQMYTSPLWLREVEEPVKYTLFCFNSINSINQDQVMVGDEITDYPTDEDDNETNDLNSMKDNNDDEQSMEYHGKSAIQLQQKVETKVIINQIFNLESSKVDDQKVHMNDSVYEKKKVTFIEGNCKKECHTTNDLTPTDGITDVIEKVKSWITIDTHRFLCGERSKNNIFSTGIETNHNDIIVEKHLELCNELHKCEFEERYRKDDEKSFPTKPLPNYEQLKKDVLISEVKVRSFYGGKTEFDIEHHEEMENNTPLLLPRIDHCEVKTTRRKILCDQLNKVLPDVLSALVLPLFTYLKDDIKLIIDTFNLTSTNIVFKQIELNIAAIFLLKLLSLRDPRLCDSLNCSTTQNHLSLILMSFKLEMNRFNDLVKDMIGFLQN